MLKHTLGISVTIVQQVIPELFLGLLSTLLALCQDLRITLFVAAPVVTRHWLIKHRLRRDAQQHE